MEIHSLMVLVCFLAGVSDVDAYHLRLTGKEGEDITITCSHSNAYSNTKYFCRGECDYEDVLITSKGPNTAKYHITDRGDDFDVTIYNLEVKDSGSYTCGVDRVGRDTYNEVHLTVVKKPREKTEPEEKKKEIGEKNETAEGQNVTDMPDGIEEHPPPSKTAVYIGLGLRICFWLLVLLPLLVFVLRRRRLGASSDRAERGFHYSASDPDAVVSSEVTVREG
ncbi:CMRF35-like molecule 9 [Synchiropus splendidus]|uniref:CMRF35-like molecule 9 n=1 Tax=Synchiropus splendidus TaxID=270530 RepID=UPI00237EE3B6|nr:CMRF35-like molecule 9 [Synchiropus splendidus]